MSLITCPECGRQISDKAAMCIGCGIPMEEIRIMLSSQEVHSVPDHSDEEMIQEPIITHSQISAETTAISSSKRIKCLNCSSEYSIGEYKCPNCGQTMLSLIKDAEIQEALLQKQGLWFSDMDLTNDMVFTTYGYKDIICSIPEGWFDCTKHDEDVVNNLEDIVEWESIDENIDLMGFISLETESYKPFLEAFNQQSEDALADFFSEWLEEESETIVIEDRGTHIISNTICPYVYLNNKADLDEYYCYCVFLPVDSDRALLVWNTYYCSNEDDEAEKKKALSFSIIKRIVRSIRITSYWKNYGNQVKARDGEEKTDICTVKSADEIVFIPCAYNDLIYSVPEGWDDTSSDIEEGTIAWVYDSDDEQIGISMGISISEDPELIEIYNEYGLDGLYEQIQAWTIESHESLQITNKGFIYVSSLKCCYTEVSLTDDACLNSFYTMIIPVAEDRLIIFIYASQIYKDEPEGHQLQDLANEVRDKIIESFEITSYWKDNKEKIKAQRDSRKKEEPRQQTEADSNSRHEDNNTVICEGIRFELPFIKDWNKRTVKPGENLNTTPHPFTVYSHFISYTQSSLDMMIYHIDKQNEQGSTISNMSNYRRTYAYSWFRKKGLDGVRDIASNDITGVFGKCRKGYSIINDDYIDVDGTRSYRLEYTHRFMNDSYFGNQKTDYCHIYIPMPGRNQLTVIEFEYVITMKDDSTNPAADDARKMMNEIIGSIKIER